MRNLKRVLGLALASVMVLSMMVVGAGAANYDDFSDKDEIVNTEAVSVLVELGVIAGKDPSLGNVTNYSYADTVGHWAAAYIEYCSNLGIVAGDGTGNFNPNATVTGSEAAKMLLVAAGYQSAIEGFTGANWAVATNVRANQVGLYDGLAVNPSEGLSRDNAAQMVYNALSAYVVTYKYTLVTDGSSLSSIPELEVGTTTVLAEKFGVVTVEGIVVANEYADIEATAAAGSAMDEGETRIVVTNHNDGQSTYTDGAKTFKVSSDKTVLGQAVTIFVKPSTTAASTSTKGTVIGSVITNSENTVVVDSSRDALEDVADDNKLKLDTDGDDATQIAVNYRSASDLSADAIDDAGTRGEVRTLIDNNDDGVVDYVLTEAFLLGKVTSYSTKDDGSITLNGTSDLSYDDAADVVGFDDVAKGDYVLYAEIGGKLYVEVAESVTGDLTAYKADGAKSTLTVDGTKYNVSGLSFYNDGNKLVTGWNYDNLDKEATFYLDAEGNVIAIDGTAASNNYAFLIKAGAVGGASDDVEAKVVLDDGTTKTYILSDDSDVESGDVNLLCTYSVSGDEITLTDVTPSETDNENITIKKGSATVTGITADTKAYANSSTVFFYVSPKGEYAADTATIAGMSVDEVNVYVGKDNVASLTYADTDKTDYLYITDDSDIKAVVVVTDSVGASSNYIYLYQFLGKNSDGWLYNAIVDGVITSDVVVADSTNPGVGLYAYTTTTDGFYKTKAIGDSGNVTRIDGNSVIIAGEEYTLTDDTVIANIDGSSTALDAVINEGDYVTVKADTDGDLVAVFVTLPYDASKTEISVDADAAEAADVTIAISGDVITVGGTNKASVTGATLAGCFTCKDEDAAVMVCEKADGTTDVDTNAIEAGDFVVVTYTDAGKTLVDTYTIAIAE